jgi:hypothetical protein
MMKGLGKSRGEVESRRLTLFPIYGCLPLRSETGRLEESGMTRPDLATPEGRRAYTAELRGVARGWRYTGLGLVTLGAIGIVAVARTDARWGAGVLGPATIAALVVGWAIIIVAIVKRTRYHRRRMTG